jgi:hypothetical protein
MGGVDERFYRELFGEVDKQGEWVYSDTNSYSIEELAARFEDVLGPEAVYDSAVTDGQILFSSGREQPVTGRLVQSIEDFSPEPPEGSLAARIGKAQDGISSKYVDSSPYLRKTNPETNPFDILVIDVPQDYHTGELSKVFEAAGKASQEVQEFHDEIDRAISMRIDN